MRLSITILSTIAAASVVSPAFAQSSPDLMCKDIVIPLGGVSRQAPVTIIIPRDKILKQCHSSIDRPLTLVDPQGGVIMAAPTYGTEKTIHYTVNDDSGHSVTAKVVIQRK